MQSQESRSFTLIFGIALQQQGGTCWLPMMMRPALCLPEYSSKQSTTLCVPRTCMHISRHVTPKMESKLTHEQFLLLLQAGRVGYDCCCQTALHSAVWLELRRTNAAYTYSYLKQTVTRAYGDRISTSRKDDATDRHLTGRQAGIDRQLGDE